MENSFFAGATTGKGFVNLYDGIVDRDTCKAFFVIKGGSGVGKSTLLKKIAASVSDRFPVEYFRCSADTDSLDGIALPNQKIAMVDGTAPHVIESKYVCCTDWTVDLSTCIDYTSLADSKATLVAINKDKADCYRYATMAISAAGKIFDTLYQRAKDGVDDNKITSLAKSLLCTDSLPRKRALFGYAITALGDVYLPCKFTKKTYRLVGNKYVAHLIMDKIKAMADALSVKYDVFYSPLNPDVVCDLVFADKVISTNPNFSADDCSIIDCSAYLEDSADDYALQLSQQRLLDWAVERFQRAKALHSEIEKIYIPCVDFEKVDKITCDIIKKLNTCLENC
ncbi:MAG: hypothetical protein ACI4MI_03035 [Christensenellales bacterium]